MNSNYRILSVFLLFLSAWVNGETLLLQSAKIHTADDGKILQQGDILIRNGIIANIAEKIRPPEDARIINLTGKVITPGLINSESALAIREINGGANASENASRDPEITAGFNVADIINPYSITVAIARRGGVSSVIVAPNSARNTHFAGLGAWFTTASSVNPTSIVAGKVMFWDFNAVAKGRGTTLPRLRAELSDAIKFSQAEDLFYNDKLRARDWSLYDLQALVPVVRGTVPLAVRVDRATDITALLEIAKNTNINLVIVGGAEGWLVAEAIAQANVPVLLDPTKNLPSNFDMVNASSQNAKRLHEAGVPILIGGPRSAHDTGKIRYFAGMAVANGLPYSIALNAITSVPAKTWGLTNVGMLKTGMRADIAVWDGDPFEPTSQIATLFINGESQVLTTRQDELEQRYIPAAKDVYAPTVKGEH